MESIEELLEAVRAGTPSTDPDVQLCMRVLMRIEPANAADDERLNDGEREAAAGLPQPPPHEGHLNDKGESESA